MSVLGRKARSCCRKLGSVLPFTILRKLLLKMGGVSIGRNVLVPRFTIVHDDVRIGTSVKIGRYVELGRGTILGDNASVENNVCIRHSKIGMYSKVHTGALIWGNENDRLVVGNHSTIGYHSILDGTDRLTIGDHVHIAGPGVGIWTHSSVHNALGGIRFNAAEYTSGLRRGSVSIGNNCWIGGNVTVYPGVHVGERTVLLPNSVIKDDVDPGTMVGGTPAHTIKQVTQIVD